MPERGPVGPRGWTGALAAGWRQMGMQASAVAAKTGGGGVGVSLKTEVSLLPSLPVA